MHGVGERPSRGGDRPPRGTSVAVILPGSGSDEHFVRRAFGGALRAVDVTLVAPAPERSARVVQGFRSALEQALSVVVRTPGARLLAGGISLGGQVATTWAAERLATDPDLPIAGLLVALPAWSGTPAGAPAAAAARMTAMTVREHGLGAALDAARAGSPPWLAGELERAWNAYGAGLADVLERAACTPGPTAGQLRGLDLPVGVAALGDDPVHPPESASRTAPGAAPPGRARHVPDGRHGRGPGCARPGRTARLAPRPRLTDRVTRRERGAGPGRSRPGCRPARGLGR